MATDAQGGGTEPDFASQLSIDEEKEPDRIKKAVLKGLLEKNVNLSDFELGELLGFKPSSIQKVRDEVAKRKMDKSGDKCHSWDYVLAFDVGSDDKIIEPSKKALENKKPDDQHEEWEKGMPQTKYYGQIINAIWGRLEDAYLKVDGFRSQEWPAAADGDAGGSDSVDKSSVTFYLTVGITENNLKMWADKRDTDLLIDPKGAVKVGRKKGFALAQRTRLTKDDEDDPNKTLPLSLWHHLYGEYNQAADPTVYKHYKRKSGAEDSMETVFDEKTRLRIIYECLIADSNEGGAEIKIEDWILKKDHPLKAVFALHDPAKQQHFHENWIKSFHPKKLMWCPLEDIRAYFGEPVAFYFGFLIFYLKWLVWPAGVGLIFFVWQMAEGKIAVAGIPFCGLFMIFWCVAFVDFWARQEARYCQQWGMTKFEDKAVARPQFDGEWVHDDVTGLWAEDYSFVARGCKQSVVYSFVVVFMSLCVFLVIYVLMLRDQDPTSQTLKIGLGMLNSVMIIIFDMIYKKVSGLGNDWENHRTEQDYQNNMIAKSFVFRFVNSFASLFFLAFFRPMFGGYGFYIRYYDSVCSEALEYMSTFLGAYDEGYTNGTVQDWPFSTYSSDTAWADCVDDSDECLYYDDLPNDEWDVVYEGYYLGSWVNGTDEASAGCGDWDATEQDDGTWYCSPGCDEATMLDDRNEVIMSELRIQLVSLFLTAIVIQNTLEVGVPLLKEWISERGDEKEQSEAEDQMEKERYSSTIDDMSEMVVQFGYVTLFVMCFPLIPLLAIINNIFEIKVDAINLVWSSQRPDPNGSNGLGTWNSVLGLFSICSVATNAALITTRTTLLSEIIADTDESVKLYFFLFLSTFLGIVVAVEKWVIPDVPDAVEKATERQRLVESVLILGTAIDDDDEDPEDGKEQKDGSEGPPDKDIEDWPFSPHPESLDVIEQTKKVPMKLTESNPESENV